MLPELDPLALRALQAIARAVPTENVLLLNALPEGVERDDLAILTDGGHLEVGVQVPTNLGTQNKPQMGYRLGHWGKPSPGDASLSSWDALWHRLGKVPEQPPAIRLTAKGRHALRLAATPTTTPPPEPPPTTDDAADPWLSLASVAKHMNIETDTIRKRFKGWKQNIDYRALPKSQRNKYEVRASVIRAVWPERYLKNRESFERETGISLPA